MIYVDSSVPLLALMEQTGGSEAAAALDEHRGEALRKVSSALLDVEVSRALRREGLDPALGRPAGLDRPRSDRRRGGSAGEGAHGRTQVPRCDPSGDGAHAGPSARPGRTPHPRRAPGRSRPHPWSGGHRPRRLTGRRHEQIRSNWRNGTIRCRATASEPCRPAAAVRAGAGSAIGSINQRAAGARIDRAVAGP